MSSEFSRSNLDHLLYLVAKEYKKQNRKGPDAELILIGGSSVILNYSFRDMTTDIDSVIYASSSMKDAIIRVADDQNLESDWLNDDFKKTSSYSAKLHEHSKFYKKFCNCLDVRTVDDEYLVAMKLKSGRVYKHDLSDIVGVIKENNEKGHDLSIEKINSAYLELYDEPLREKDATLLKQIFSAPDYGELYYTTVDDEAENKQLLKNAERDYKGVLNQDNVAQFLKGMRKRHPSKRDELDSDAIHLTDTVIHYDAPDNNKHPKI